MYLYQQLETIERSPLVKAPWTESEIRSLGLRQEDVSFHPYTCGLCGSEITPCQNGWYCPECAQIVQNWAYSSDIQRYAH